MRWALYAATLVALSQACQPGAFTCFEDTECSGGVCQSSGYCSFPSNSCDSGQRYGEHAGALAGQCVELGGSESTASGPSTPDMTTATTNSTLPSPDGSSGEPGTTTPLSTTSGSSSDVDTGTDSNAESSESTSSDSSSTGEPLDPDLLLWYRFEDLPTNDTLDSAQGIAATCLDGQCPTPTPGPWGTAALFDGDDDGLDIPFDPQFELPSQMSAMAWIRADQLDGEIRRGIFGHPSGGGFLNSWVLMFLDNDLDRIWEIGLSMNAGGDAFLFYDLPFELGTWVHVAGTYDGATARFYIDGMLMGEDPSAPSMFDPTKPLTIGYDINADSPDGPFHGAIDEVRLYSRALEPEEIAELASR